MESLLVLKQPSCNVFQIRNECWRFSEHQKKTGDTDKFEGYFFTGRVSQVNVNTVERFFGVAKGLILHVLSSSYNVSSSEIKRK